MKKMSDVVIERILYDQKGRVTAVDIYDKDRQKSTFLSNNHRELAWVELIAIYWIEILATIFFIDLTAFVLFLGLFMWGVWQTFCVLGAIMVVWGLFDWFCIKEAK
jgi:hypothetical protein